MINYWLFSWLRQSTGKRLIMEDNLEKITYALLWFSIVSTGLMAGVYYTFSAFVVRSLDAIAAPQGMIAMQSINKIIVKSTFLPMFLASTLVCAGLAVLALLNLAVPGAINMFIGGSLYVVGMFVVTLAGNVPLNNRLEMTRPDAPEALEIWALYLQKWIVWNHVRTVACTVSMVFLVLAIAARS